MNILNGVFWKFKSVDLLLSSIYFSIIKSTESADSVEQKLVILSLEYYKQCEIDSK